MKISLDRHRNPATSRQPVDTAGSRSTRWLLLAVGLAVGGCVLSLLAGLQAARADDASTARGFERSAAEISGLLRVAIQHEQDLVVSAGAFVTGNPGVTEAELFGWITSVRAIDRYPELVAIGAMTYVTADDLPGFLAQVHADPATPPSSDQSPDVTPAGERPFYCLVQAIVTVAPGVAKAPPLGPDYCVGQLGVLVLAARDSGEASYLTVPSSIGQQLVVQSPIYRGGGIPDSVQARREAYLGNIGTVLAPDVVFADVLQGHPDETITLSYIGGASSTEFFSSQSAPDDVRSITTDFGNGWRTTISHSRAPDGLFASTQGIALVASGTVTSLMLGILIFVLGTGRNRALRLVARRTDELRHQALHDGLTQLPNRTLILDRVEQMLGRSRRNGSAIAALFLDLDGFKNINDTLGHDAGDQLLCAVGARLTTGLRGIDTVGRLGGDEFVVLVEDGPTRTDPVLVAERILELLRQPFELDLAPRPVVISCSVGIAVGIRDTAADLLRDADIALYQAKAAGRNCHETFRPDMESAVQHQYELEFDLRSALANDQFRLFYQPIYDLSDLTIVGAEALIRWEHPTLGLVQPDDFVPLLEASGQIIEVGHWVLMNACRQAQRWLEQGNDLTVSVNVSARQLDRDSVIDHVTDALRASRLDPAHLTLEITETVLMKDTDLTARRLHALKALGVKIAIDDFGTGYSSLAYLQKFPSIRSRSTAVSPTRSPVRQKPMR